MKSPNWTEEEKNILINNINKLPYSKIIEFLPGRTIEAIKQRGYLMGLEKSGKHFPKRTLDEDFFDKKDLLTSYWAGFIAADGCIVTSPRRELRIGLHERDLKHLEIFAKDVKYNGKIGKKTKENAVHLTICAIDKWIKDIKNNYNIGPRKTLTLKPPRIEGKQALAYSIGYIDGDGCWAYVDNKYLVLIIVGTKSILEWLKLLWIRNGIKINANVRPIKNKKCWRLSISGQSAKDISQLLNKIETPKLNRKWKISRGESKNQKGGP